MKMPSLQHAHKGVLDTNTYSERPPRPPVVDAYGLFVPECKADVCRGYEAGSIYIYLDRGILPDWYMDRGASYTRIRFEGREGKDVDVPTVYQGE